MFFRRHSDKADALKAVPLFNDLNQKQMNQLARHATEVTIEAGTILAKQGSYGLEFMYIVDGQARVEKNGKTINHLSKGDFFGEISLIDGGLRTATVIAETKITLLVVHKQSFDHMLDAMEGLERKILLALCKYLRSTEER
ncbi:cyclic nucleotide-binding domain-containing protein [Candidatus Acetothermia bacterium]|nr:cyclic nucleotide-binding domain-containing protein [Candidatus Acetothermia bacterium]